MLTISTAVQYTFSEFVDKFLHLFNFQNVFAFNRLGLLKGRADLTQKQSKVK